MVIIYTTSSNLGSRKATEWFQEQGLEYKQIRVNKTPLTKEQFLELLVHSENGLSDFLSLSGQSLELDSLSLNDAIDILIKNPRFIKKPIIFDGKTVFCGFVDTELGVFIPKEQRTKHYLGV